MTLIETPTNTVYMVFETVGETMTGLQQVLILSIGLIVVFWLISVLVSALTGRPLDTIFDSDDDIYNGRN